jgi:hypothetical protein
LQKMHDTLSFSSDIPNSCLSLLVSSQYIYFFVSALTSMSSLTYPHWSRFLLNLVLSCNANWWIMLLQFSQIFVSSSYSSIHSGCHRLSTFSIKWIFCSQFCYLAKHRVFKCVNVNQ